MTQQLTLKQRLAIIINNLQDVRQRRVVLLAQVDILTQEEATYRQQLREEFDALDPRLSSELFDL